MATMASANDDAAAMLREYAELLSITGGDPFRARNYEKAAKAVAGYPGDLAAVPDPALTKIPGARTRRTLVDAPQARLLAPGSTAG